MYRYFLMLLLPIVISFSVSAQKRTYNTARITSGTPVIDGILNDDAWNSVEWSGDFIQRQPYANRPPSQQTRFKILYDDNNLYVAVRCFDTAPDSIERRMSRRDGFPGDWVEINIDSYHDLRTAFSFTISASGVKGDEAITNDDNWDSSWDPNWYAKTAVDSKGWIAEIRIPFTQLRFGKQEDYVWGLQLSRRLFRKQEISCWQYVSPNAAGWVHYFGELHGIKDITPKKQKDIIPYAVGSYNHYEKEDGNPFADGKNYSGNVGVDGKFGITNDLTLDFTVNPDFGQVEADPSEVNLTTFETKFSEKRPFFIEGKNILSFRITGGDGGLSNDNLFYSRRIGRRPSRSIDLADSEYAKIPKSTTILGAFKLTGKTRKGWSIGAMESITQKEMAEIDREGVRSQLTAEPFTNYFAARIQKDMDSANTRIGGMITSVNRNLSDPYLTSTMGRSAYTGGINFERQWKDQTYYFHFNTVFSLLQGSKEAMTEIQTSSPHFFQRPDAKYLKVDSSLTSLTGWGGNVEFGKAGNSKWMYLIWITWRSPGLDLNDIGYMRQSDEIQQVAWAGFRQNEPFSIFRNLGLNFNEWYGLNFGLEKKYMGGNVGAYGTFKNYWNANIGISRDNKSLSFEELRGGPALLYDGGINIWTNLSTDQRKKLQFYTGFNTDVRDYNTAHGQYYYLGVNAQLTDAFRISIEPDFSKRMDEINYVNTLDELPNVRYIRGTIDQSTIQTTVRFNYNLTPDFTVQFYAMPFISAGKYRDFKFIDNPRADKFSNRFVPYTDDQISYNGNDEVYEIDENRDGNTDYTFDNPNFNVFDFNLNMVVRWEYSPGSVLYLVWSRNQNTYQSTGDFSLRRDVKTLFDTYPNDVFLIKLSYRLGL